MQVRASGDYKKPHQSGDVRASCAPSAHRRLRRRLRPRRRCAARHCGWDMIRRHIILSAFGQLLPPGPLHCLCLAAVLKGKWRLSQGDGLRVSFQSLEAASARGGRRCRHVHFLRMTRRPWRRVPDISPDVKFK